MPILDLVALSNPGVETQACLNFDPRRAAGNTVILFSCGGRADGGLYHLFSKSISVSKANEH